MLKRAPDGEMRPVSAKELEVYRKQFAVIDQLFSQAFAPGVRVEEGLQMMKEAQEKIQDAQKELK